MRYKIKHLIIVLPLILITALTTAAQEAKKSLPTLRGAEAVEQLKQDGQYDSLMDAVKSARQKDGQTDAPTEDAVGQNTKLLASDAATSDVFGYSVAISGDTIVVGAYAEDTAPNGDNGAAYVFVRSGTAWTEQAKLLASDAATGDQFGWSVAISGDTIVVGARLEDTAPNTDNGAAYIFVRSGTTWTEQAKLLASDAASSDLFGWSVAISGDTAVVGAFVEGTAPNTNNGAAYIFVRSGTTWTQQAKLLASDAASGDQFGYSVAISGDTIVVGARTEDTAPNTDNGAAYIFVRSGTTWTEQAKLLASDAASSDWFGYSVAISGDTIVVGARLEDTAPNTDNGAAYIFVRSGTTWTEQAKLLASDAASSDQFGYSVAISGANIMVGAPSEDTAPNSNNGAVYAFRFLSGNWTQEAQKVASDGAASDRFGYSVAISGDTAIIGAHLEDTAPNIDNGAAYVFVRIGTTWTEQAKLLASDAATNDNFGVSVAISGDTAIIGAVYEDTAPNTDNGAAYVFVRSGTTWTQQAKLLASDAASQDYFGVSVAISGDTTIIGAVGEDTAPNSSNGAAYVFVRSGTTWTQQAKLLASDGATNDNFGTSVAISGDTAIIGAYFEDTAPNTDNGAAYVFVRSGTVWSQQAKLLASDAASSDLFGTSVAISGDTAVIGAYLEDTAPNTNQGAAYVFVRSGTSWTEQAKLLASDAASNDHFGWSVAISGDTAVIGARSESTAPNSFNGAAYVFSRTGTTWSQVSKLTDSARADGDAFGWSVGISGDKIVVGAPNSDASTSTPLTSGKTEDFVPSATDQGAVYFFVNTPLAPTAAGVSISGRVLTPEGAGLRNAIVYLTKQNGETVSTRSTTFGYYRFEDIAAGQTVIIGVSAKRYMFEPLVLPVSDNLTDLNLQALP